MRSKLFVPGSRPELFEKAYLSGADAISFDLEDAVAEGRKAAARGMVADALDRRPAGGRPIVIVRVNGRSTEHFDADLEAVVRNGLDMINVPKVEDADDIRAAAAKLDELERVRGLKHRIGILANIETPRGVRLAAEIAAADGRVTGLQLGFGDLFEPFGISRGEPSALNTVRLNVKLAAAERGLPVYDGAFVDIADTAGYRAEAESAHRLGLAGKSCVHPTQIAIANAVFVPRPAEVARARKIVAAADEMLARGVGAFKLEGVLVDGPFIARAREIVALAEEADRGSRK